MQKERFIYLFTAYYNKSCTVAERSELMQAIKQGDKDEWLTEAISSIMEMHVADKRLDPKAASELYTGIMEAIKEDQPSISPARKVNYWKRIAVAASALLVMSVAAYLWLGKSQQKDIAETLPAISNDIPPGNNKATLKLADGSTIDLNDAVNGWVAQQGNTNITKQDSGLLAYNVTSSYEAIKTIHYNEVSTPRGGQYKIILPDGSKVWLNAASSLQFPTAFSGRERLVELTGEGYFEVVKNADMPFRVKAGSTTIEALGTQFNVTAYKDEALLKTTLVEGKVRVTNNSHEVVLSPGQQAGIDDSGNISKTADVNVPSVIAWKEGLFAFDDIDITVVMRQICRWYDMEVQYLEKPLPETYYGKIRRNTNLSEVLKVLKMSGVDFTVKGNLITVIQ